MIRLIGQRWKRGNMWSWLILIVRGLNQFLKANSFYKLLLHYLVLREWYLKQNSLAAMARRSHPFPYRTRKLSFSAPMVVGTRVPVRVGRCQAHQRQPEKVVFLLWREKKIYRRTKFTKWAEKCLSEGYRRTKLHTSTGKLSIGMAPKDKTL